MPDHVPLAERIAPVSAKKLVPLSTMLPVSMFPVVFTIEPADPRQVKHVVRRFADHRMREVIRVDADQAEFPAEQMRVDRAAGFAIALAHSEVIGDPVRATVLVVVRETNCNSSMPDDKPALADADNSRSVIGRCACCAASLARR